MCLSHNRGILPCYWEVQLKFRYISLPSHNQSINDGPPQLLHYSVYTVVLCYSHYSTKWDASEPHNCHRRTKNYLLLMGATSWRSKKWHHHWLWAHMWHTTRVLSCHLHHQLAQPTSKHCINLLSFVHCILSYHHFQFQSRYCVIFHLTWHPSLYLCRL